MNSINIPSCLLVSSATSVRQGSSLNDISSFILNQELPKNIYRENATTDSKILHNLKMLLKGISSLLPNNLSKITANDLLMDHTKLFLLLRWMVKILDYPFYQKLKASFQGLYLKASQDTDRREEGKMQRMKAAFSRKHAGEDPSEAEKPRNI